ncbi:PIN domain-containing protein [Silvibacterium dinghuense]|uniref:Ribonuclease VapC n=1 Tax=Silvibacterium dinghuense TaxID=1560006 RepID=A0A4Q1SIZ1_9BACT|nr:PIN domain-containing protein [Silvibacterium dinghuense]RXS97385.1 PIN domain-containing protein [Silvibacterium dinghuense]GGG98577.1 twitching motility protein PilT [Silvibacterium dinghuense]
MSVLEPEAPDFLDTNILVYAWDSGSPAKQRVARELLTRAIAGEMMISAQVLGEFTATLLHKLRPQVAAQEVKLLLGVLEPIRRVATDAATVRRALDAHLEYGLHFYDGMIVAAAELGGCRRIFSEDLNAGQSYFGVTVENPFRA